MVETPPTTELRRTFDLSLIEKAVNEVLGLPMDESRQMLLIAWKGTESSRCILLTINQSKGWVGQFDGLIGYLKNPPVSNGVPLNPYGKKLTESITQYISEHSDYELPMLLVVWQPKDSVLFDYYWMNVTRAWDNQRYALYCHIRDLCQYTRQRVWAQADYEMAVAMQEHGASKKAKPKIYTP